MLILKLKILIEANNYNGIINSRSKAYFKFRMKKRETNNLHKSVAEK